MVKDIMSRRGAFSSIRVSKIGGNDNNAIWNTEKINALLEQIDNGLDIKGLHNSPFKDNDVNLKRPNLPFEYTPEEWEELSKCKADLIYFAYNYCKIQTHDGIKFVKDGEGLRDFQEEILKSFKDNNYNILMASRQTGKSVTSAIFMLWFLLFHEEKNALIVADNFTTTKELMDKFRISLDGLPFFMKPGIKHINSGNIKFDNDSRIVARTTTKKSGIGLSINVLYMDEFAHIDAAKLDEFYRAVLPTVTADPNAKVIITSTPNGQNKFYEIWIDAVNKKSEYVPLRVDWWQVEGRDEEWKQKKIALLGSVEDFNQEYGLQFFSSDRLLLSSNDLKRLDYMKTEYENPQFDLDEDHSFLNSCLFFHPKYSKLTLDEIRRDPSNFIFSIDTADGEGGDYSVMNIYKLVTMPVKELLKRKESIRNEVDTVSLVQIGYLRSNELDINKFNYAVEYTIYRIFKPDNTRILLEMNHKGEMIYNNIKSHDNFWPGQTIYSKHTEMAVQLKPGIRLGPTNKIKYCEKFKFLISSRRILPNDYVTVMELASFGKSKGGVYRGQNGNDDLAMTSVNLSAFFDSPQFWELAVETFERSSEDYQTEVKEKIFNIHQTGSNKSMYDYDTLKKLNQTPESSDLNKPVNPNVFDIETLNHMQKIKSRFFKT